MSNSIGLDISEIKKMSFKYSVTKLIVTWRDGAHPYYNNLTPYQTIQD